VSHKGKVVGHKEGQGEGVKKEVDCFQQHVKLRHSSSNANMLFTDAVFEARLLYFSLALRSW